MKPFNPSIPGVVVVVFALCSIGAKTEGCMPSGSTSNKTTQSNQNPKPWCHSDPPIFCAAYCADYDSVLFNKQCYEIGADILTLEFMDRVDALYAERVELGEHLCTEYDPYNYVTPCQVFITPQEWPDQDHDVCEPVPPGCPMPK
jgi:hypothetical protein